jgi:hypothetical protein
MVVRCIAKVADAYKLDRNSKRSFRQLGSVAYDAIVLVDPRMIKQKLWGSALWSPSYLICCQRAGNP